MGTTAPADAGATFAELLTEALDLRNTIYYNSPPGEIEQAANRLGGVLAQLIPRYTRALVNLDTVQTLAASSTSQASRARGAAGIIQILDGK